MCKKDFDALTDAQYARDSEFLEQAREKLVKPLVHELEQAVPGYLSLTAWDRFLALMRLNEKVAPKGDSLILDFGYYKEAGKDGRRMRGAAYSGEEAMTLCREVEGVKLYAPLFQELRMAPWDDFYLSHPGSMLALGAREVREYSWDDLLSGNPDNPGKSHKFSNEFPLPFMVAIVSLYLRENVLISPADSCCFAAGWETSVQPRRWDARPLKADTGQWFGHCITIRDPLPENEMATHIARSLRSYTKAHASINPERRDSYIGDIPSIAEYEPSKKQTRSRHQSTELLMNFFTHYLPERGMYAGRSGVGEKISMKKAFAIFDALHPGLYKSPTTFANSYYNARKAGEGR